MNGSPSQFCLAYGDTEYCFLESDTWAVSGEGEPPSIGIVLSYEDVVDLEHPLRLEPTLRQFVMTSYGSGRTAEAAFLGTKNLYSRLEKPGFTLSDLACEYVDGPNAYSGNEFLCSGYRTETESYIFLLCKPPRDGIGGTCTHVEHYEDFVVSIYYDYLHRTQWNVFSRAIAAITELARQRGNNG